MKPPFVDVRPLVVIMRGLPGSGKSTWIERHFGGDPQQRPTICSADHFFARGAGVLTSKQMKRLTPSEIYQQTWRPELVQSAHAACHAEFNAALESKDPLVIVDNTHVQVSHLSRVRTTAIEAGYRVAVVEMECPSDEAVKEFARRGLHPLPIKTLFQLRQSFEHLQPTPSPLANPLDLGCFRVPFLPSQSLPSQSTHRALPSLSQFVASNNLLHNSKQRRKTHLVMATGEGWRKGTRFLDVPESLTEEFWRVYLADDSGAKHLCEMAEGEPFRLFFDIDDDSASVHSHLPAIVSCLREVAGPHVVLVSGCLDDGKTGLHLRMPARVVTAPEALQLRVALCQRLSRCPELSHYRWEQLVDRMVYVQVTLRMYGSRKATKGCDVGRLYHIHAVYDRHGLPDPVALLRYQSDLLSWLRDSSIRLSSKK